MVIVVATVDIEEDKVVAVVIIGLNGMDGNSADEKQRGNDQQ